MQTAALALKRVRKDLPRHDWNQDGLGAALQGVPVLERDSWVDSMFGIAEVPADDPALPRGCVPYLPCPVEAVLALLECIPLGPGDVFLDVGAGMGRVCALVELLSGATTIGLEIQPQLVARARELALHLGLEKSSMLQGEAVSLISDLPSGDVFFLYCPFSGARLERLLDELKRFSTYKPIWICTVHLVLPVRSWLVLFARERADLAVYRSR